MRRHFNRRARNLACAMALLAMAQIGPALAQTPASDLLPQIPPELLRELAKPDADVPPSAAAPGELAPRPPCHGRLPRVNGRAVCDGTPPPSQACERLPRVNGRSACAAPPD